MPLGGTAVHVTVAEASPAVAVTLAGASGVLMGVVIALTPGAPVPALLVAVTWKVYGVPLVRPLIVLLVEGALTVTEACAVPPL